MATKVYGISGKTTVEINIPVGRALLPLVFENGSLDRKTYKPATYSTNKKAIQDMIEGSPLFGKTIKLYKVYGSEEPAAKVVAKVAAPAAPRRPKPAPGKPKPAPAPAEPENEDKNEDKKEEAAADPSDAVTTREEALVYLKKNGAKATDLIDDDAMKAYMAKSGITFKNFTV